MRKVQIAFAERKDNILDLVNVLSRGKEEVCFIVVEKNSEHFCDISKSVVESEEDVIKKVNREVSYFSNEIEMLNSIKGSQYLRKSIAKVVHHPELLNGITKLLYPEVAKEFHTSGRNVERAMRTAVERIWAKGNQEYILQVFGYNKESNLGKPTNTQFIEAAADYIRKRI